MILGSQLLSSFNRISFSKQSFSFIAFSKNSASDISKPFERLHGHYDTI